MQYFEENRSPELLNKSINFSLKSIEIDSINGITSRIPHAYYNLGSAYIETGSEEKVKKGMEYLMRVKSIVDTIDEYFQTKIVVYNKLALLESRKGNYKNAIV